MWHPLKVVTATNEGWQGRVCSAYTRHREVWRRKGRIWTRVHSQLHLVRVLFHHFEQITYCLTSYNQKVFQIRNRSLKRKRICSFWIGYNLNFHQHRALWLSTFPEVYEIISKASVCKDFTWTHRVKVSQYLETFQCWPWAVCVLCLCSYWAMGAYRGDQMALELWRR